MIRFRLIPKYSNNLDPLFRQDGFLLVMNNRYSSSSHFGVKGFVLIPKYSNSFDPVFRRDGLLLVMNNRYSNNPFGVQVFVYSPNTVITSILCFDRMDSSS